MVVCCLFVFGLRVFGVVVRLAYWRALLVNLFVVVGYIALFVCCCCCLCVFSSFLSCCVWFGCSLFVFGIVYL